MIKKFIIFFIIIGMFSPISIFAQNNFDSDNDGLTNDQEISIYYTDPNKADTDGDGYNDKQEIDTGYSPHQANKKMSELDWDGDSLTDDLELKFKTDIKNPDSDGDGYKDGAEVWRGFDPLNSQSVQLAEKIEVNLAKQEIYLFLKDIKIATYLVSSGLPGKETPLGEFQIYNKGLKVWSRSAGLWMPYWLSFTKNGVYSLHELPVWPNGVREGEDHLGKPASHGCIRLGVGPAKQLYNWARIGTKVVIR